MDFANILFAGPCNRRCPFCIGRQLPERVNTDNLALFPPRNLGALIAEVNRLGIREVVFTGTVTDPQLYRHEAALLELLRREITTGARYSLHTNGALALQKRDVLNLYDKACISLPSFEPDTYEKMMGSRKVPDLERILAAATIPLKVSCLVNEHNVGEVDSFLDRCRRIGLRRLVLRRLYGDTRAWPLLRDRVPVRSYRSNPVYDWDGMEVTYWNFEESQSTSLNLFADGTLGESYLLARTPFSAGQGEARQDLQRPQGIEDEAQVAQPVGEALRRGVFLQARQQRPDHRQPQARQGQG